MHLAIGFNTHNLTKQTQHQTQKVDHKGQVFKETLEAPKQTQKDQVEESIKTAANDKRLSKKQPKEIQNVKKQEITCDTKKDQQQSIEEISDEITSLIASILHITPQQVIEKLEALNIQPIELLNEAVFGQWMREELGDDLGLMLENDTKVKAMLKLFDQLAPMREHVQPLLIQEPLQVLPEMTTTPPQENMASQVAPILEESLDVVATKELKGRIKAIQYEKTQELTHYEEPFILPVNKPLDQQLVNSWHQTQSQNTLQPQTYVAIDQQILQQVDFAKLTNDTEIILALSPKQLGKLTLKISEDQGVITTTIHVESEKTKILLMGQLDALKQSLQEQGLKVGDFQVDVRQDTQQRQRMYKERQKSSKRIQEMIAKHLQEQEEVYGTDESNQINDAISHEVDYKA